MKTHGLSERQLKQQQLPSQLCSVLFLSVMLCGMECPSVQAGSCPAPVPSLAGWCEGLKSAWPGVSTALQQLNHGCVIGVIFLLNPKHSAVPATIMEINSTLFKTRTEAFLFLVNLDTDIIKLAPGGWFSRLVV